MSTGKDESASPSTGLPGLRGIEHVGLTVPDIDAATRFLVDVIGCRFVYAMGPLRDDGGDWMAQHLNVDRAAVVKELRFLRCGHGPNIELFEYSTPHQSMLPPRNSDAGGHHLAFYVDDFEAALAHLRKHGVRILGEPTVRTEGPSAGQTWIYFLAPWGTQFELVSYPDGKGYEAASPIKLWHPAHPLS